MATGMALRECLISRKLQRPQANHIIWPRIDQKSCLKSMLSIGLSVIVIEPKLADKGLVTDVQAIEAKIKELGAENILAIHTTISCFAPRQPDSIEAVAKISHTANIPHIINGAYFLQSKKSVNLVNAACGKNRRIDAIVLSTDKNFMTPVGGSVVISPLKKDSLVQKIASNYPGRASMSPKLDLFITLLQMGKNGYRSLLANQIACYNKLLDSLKSLSELHGTKVIAANGISIAISLKPFENCLSDLKEIGSMLFTRNVSGPRVVTCKESKEIGQGADLYQLLGSNKF